MPLSDRRSRDLQRRARSRRARWRRNQSRGTVLAANSVHGRRSRLEPEPPRSNPVRTSGSDRTIGDLTVLRCPSNTKGAQRKEGCFSIEYDNWRFPPPTVRESNAVIEAGEWPDLLRIAHAAKEGKQPDDTRNITTSCARTSANERFGFDARLRNRRC